MKEDLCKNYFSIGGTVLTITGSTGMKKQSRKDLVKAIRLTWGSLDTHLDSTYKNDSKTEKKLCGGKHFHAKTCEEYAFTILVMVRSLRKERRMK